MGWNDSTGAAQITRMAKKKIRKTEDIAMKPERIDLFVDRLCGIFPRDNIARNTVKNTWSRDDYLLSMPEGDIKAALAILENDKGFPALARVKEVFRGMHKQSVRTRAVCTVCSGNGWDDGIRWEEQAGSFVMIKPRNTQTILGTEYTYVTRCGC